MAKQTEIFVKESLGELNWDYSANKPDSSCYPPALADVISCLSKLAYDLLRPAAKPKRKRDIKNQDRSTSERLDSMFMDDNKRKESTLEKLMLLVFNLTFIVKGNLE